MAQAPVRGALLYLHPFAEEMNRSRRMAALQARELARKGWYVLQLDLSGCGDSEGDFGEATWEAWLHDAATAHAWLEQKTGYRPWAWGLRAGARLAAELARDGRGVFRHARCVGDNLRYDRRRHAVRDGFAVGALAGFGGCRCDDGKRGEKGEESVRSTAQKTLRGSLPASCYARKNLLILVTRQRFAKRLYSEIAAIRRNATSFNRNDGGKRAARRSCCRREHDEACAEATGLPRNPGREIR